MRWGEAIGSTKGNGKLTPFRVLPDVKITGMAMTYDGTLQNNHIEWENESPKELHDGRPIRVRVTVLEEGSSPSEQERRDRMVAALEELGRLGTFAGIDPVEWQREQRVDRPLPGRGD